MAEQYEEEYQQTGDPWLLVKASRSRRQSGQPALAIKHTDSLLRINTSWGARLMSAILTTRGGALRDLYDLDAARICAEEAVSRDTQSFYPHNLLGAIYFQEGEPARGEWHFEEARRLGARLGQQETEMRNAMERAGEIERRKVANYLVQKDPQQYDWARLYLEE
jgi:hypothetical protein